MRTIWNGSISFGLVNIPIGLAVATQRTDVSFRTLHRECKTPIKQKRYCPVHERDVGPDELVKGWEFVKGQYVIVEEDDLEAVALQRSNSIEILRFVQLEEVDPVFFDRTYYLAPADAEAQRRPYVLLLRAMEDTGMAAIGKFVLWGKENLCLIRPQGTPPARDAVLRRGRTRQARHRGRRGRERRQGGRARSRAPGDREHPGEFEPEEFRNEYRDDLRQMLEAKLAGQEIAKPEPVAGDAGDRPDGGAEASVAETKKQPAAKRRKRPRQRGRSAGERRRVSLPSSLRAAATCC